MRAPLISPEDGLGTAGILDRGQGAARADNLRGMALMVLCMATFTSNDSLMKMVTTTLPLYESIAIRGVMVLALMLGVARVQGYRIRLTLPRRDLGPLVLRGTTDIVSTLLYLVALRHLALADISAIMQALPLAMTLAAALVFGERLGWRRIVAISVGFIGVMIILRPGSGTFEGWGLVALAAMGLIVLRDIATRLFSPAVGSSTIAFHAAALVMLAGFVMGLTEEWRIPTRIEFGLLALAACFVMVGYLTAVAAMRVGEVSFVAPFRYSSLIWAIVLGLVMFGDWPDLWTWTGSALVVGAGIYSFMREGRLRRRA